MYNRDSRTPPQKKEDNKRERDGMAAMAWTDTEHLSFTTQTGLVSILRLSKSVKQSMMKLGIEPRRSIILRKLFLLFKVGLT